MSRASAPCFIAVIGDLVKSRDLPDRRAAQEALSSTLEEINAKNAGDIAARFKITQGDEFQGLLAPAGRFSEIWWSYQERMRAQAVTRFGVGIGPIATALEEEPGEIDGPCFHAARAAIEWGHRKRANLVFRVHGLEEIGEALSRLAGLIGKTVQGWTDVQWETVGLLRKLGSQSKVAQERGVTHQSIGDVLTSSLGSECLEAWGGLEQILAWVVEEADS